MKKGLIYLLLLITMAGTFCPCCMDDDCLEETAQQESPSHNNHSDKSTCSPFFACGTCAASVDLPTPGIELITATPVPVTHQSFYLLHLGTYSPSLFQPPRFA